GVSMIQTAEGALNEVHDMLQRMRELSVQGANGVYEKDDLAAIANEIEELTEQIEKIANDTEFNGIKLLNGEGISDADELNLQIGSDEGQHLGIEMEYFNITIGKLG